MTEYTKISNVKKGFEFEKYVIDYLSNKGFKIVKHRYFSPYGEIDIIAFHNEVLYIIEVKYRSNDLDASSLLTYNKVNNIYNSLLCFLDDYNQYLKFCIEFYLCFINKRHIKFFPFELNQYGIVDF
ncbi:MAG: YraN family protein [Anaplasmataceae bacterium]|nr:YraN family protein [Anaplasmataceae bacterium]